VQTTLTPDGTVTVEVTEAYTECVPR